MPHTPVLAPAPSDNSPIGIRLFENKFVITKTLSHTDAGFIGLVNALNKDDTIDPSIEYIIKGVPELAESDEWTEAELHAEASAVPGVVEFLGCDSQRGAQWICMPHLHEGDLHSRIAGGYYLQRLDKLKLQMLQLVDTVAGMHSLATAHLDIKPENVLVSGDELFLADFGLATKAPYLEEVRGTPNYMAPEVEWVLRMKAEEPGFAYDTLAADMWSLGATLYAMAMNRNPPFKIFLKEDGEFLESIGEHADLFEGLSPDFMALLRQTMHPLAEERLSAAEALRWLQKMGSIFGPTF